MSAIPVLQYVVGLGIFGFTYWLLDGILETVILAGVHKTGSIFDYLLYFWTGCIVLYIIFGGWWVVRKYNEAEYQGRS